MAIYISSSPLDGFFIMPMAAADGLDKVDGRHIKVLVWLCAHSGKPAEPSKIAQELGILADEVESSVQYWVDRGVLIQSASSLSLAARMETAPAAKRIYSLPQYSSEQIAEATANNEGLKFLLSEAERVLEKMLAPSDVATLFALYDWLKLPVEVIVVIMQYCVSQGKRSMRYIEKAAIAWHEKGINTLDKADEHLARLEKCAGFEKEFMRMVGISGRVLTAGEKEYIERWCVEWGFSFDMVEHAYEIAVLKTGKLSMPYINSILRRWKDAGITTVEQASGERPKSAKPASGQSYDLDEFVRLSREKIGKESKE